MLVNKRTEVQVYLLFALVYVAGLVYTCLLSTRPLIAQGVYIDENALLAGQAITAPLRVDTMFATDKLLYECVYDMPKCISLLLTESGWDVVFTPTLVPDTHDIPSASAPYGLVRATLRPPRTPGSETIVLVAQPPLRDLPLSSSPSSLAILLEASRGALQQRYLSRDITLLIPVPPPLVSAQPHLPPQKPHLLIARALALSHDIIAEGLAAAPLPSLPMMSLALEVPPHTCGSSVTMVPGAYGGQGNLDVTSTAFATFRLPSVASEPAMPPAAGVCAPFSSRPAARNACTSPRTSASAPSTPIQHLASLLNAVTTPITRAWDAVWAAAGRPRWSAEGLGTARTMLWQLLGGPQGLHASLAIRTVDSVLVGVLNDGTTTDLDARAQGRTRCMQAMESVWRGVGEGSEQWIRSASNVHERLHHSLWLHLLASSTNFTAMGKYIPAFVLLWAPLALALVWVLLTQPAGNEGAAAMDMADMGGVSSMGSEEATQHLSAGAAEESSKLSSQSSRLSAWSLGRRSFLTMLVVLASLVTPFLPASSLSTFLSSPLLAPILYLALLFVFFLLCRVPHHPALLLAPLTLFLSPISLLSFSLALALAALLTPTLLLALLLSQASLPLRLATLPLLFLFSPLTILVLPRIAALPFDYNTLMVPCPIPHTLLSLSSLATLVSPALHWLACLLQSPLLHTRVIALMHVPAWTWAVAVVVWGGARNR